MKISSQSKTNQKKELIKQLRIISAITPGAGDSKERIKKEITAEKHGHTEESHGSPHGAHGHKGGHGAHIMSREESSKIFWIRIRKIFLAMIGMLIGLIIMGIPGYGLIGLAAAFFLCPIFYVLGGKAPPAHH